MLIDGKFVEIGEVSPVNAGILPSEKAEEEMKPLPPGAWPMYDKRKSWPMPVFAEWTAQERTITMPYDHVATALSNRTYDIGREPRCLVRGGDDVFEAVSVLIADNTVAHLGCGWRHALLAGSKHVYESKPVKVGKASMEITVNVNGSWINWFSYNDGHGTRKVYCDNNSTMQFIKMECYKRGLRDPYIGSPICEIAGESWNSMWGQPTQMRKFEWGMIHDSRWRRNYRDKTKELIQLLKDGAAYHKEMSNRVHSLEGRSVPTCCWYGQKDYILEAIENGVWSPDNDWC